LPYLQKKKNARNIFPLRFNIKAIAFFPSNKGNWPFQSLQKSKAVQTDPDLAYGTRI